MNKISAQIQNFHTCLIRLTKYKRAEYNLTKVHNGAFQDVLWLLLSAYSLNDRVLSAIQ